MTVHDSFDSKMCRWWCVKSQLRIVIIVIESSVLIGDLCYYCSDWCMHAVGMEDCGDCCYLQLHVLLQWLVHACHRTVVWQSMTVLTVKCGWGCIELELWIVITKLQGVVVCMYGFTKSGGIVIWQSMTVRVHSNPYNTGDTINCGSAIEGLAGAVLFPTRVSGLCLPENCRMTVHDSYDSKMWTRFTEVQPSKTRWGGICMHNCNCHMTVHDSEMHSNPLCIGDAM
jgi:hypothetical protein